MGIGGAPMSSEHGRAKTRCDGVAQGVLPRPRWLACATAAASARR